MSQRTFSKYHQQALAGGYGPIDAVEQAERLEALEFPRAETPANTYTARGAEIHLNDWILASPATRACWGLDRIGGKWRVGLSVDGGDGRFERLPMAQHEDYAQCVINAIEIARLAGYA